MPHLAYNLLMLAVDIAAIATRRQRLGALVDANIALIAGVSGLLWGWQIFGLMQAAAWLLFFHLPLLLLSHPRARLWAVPLLLVGADAFLIEPYWLVVRTHTLALDGLTQPVRVALVADLQTDRVGRHEHRALERLAASEPDLILFAGDYIQLAPGPEFEAQAAALWPSLAALDPPLGAYAVGGDVDRHHTWPAIFDNTQIMPLAQSQTIDVGPLVVTGLSLGHSRAARPPIAAQTKPHIAFGHAPDFSLAAPPADLLLAGHTHGGQVQLPFFGPLMKLSHVPRDWAGGDLIELPQGGHLRVSRGVGMERAHAPRLRFLCRPELVLIDLVPR